MITDDHTKIYTAAPPDVLRVDEKRLREYYVFNCLGFLITTKPTDGIYLPEDDRRHYVIWSDLKKTDFPEDYWQEMWNYYRDGGLGHVAAYLATLDISNFDPKAPPPKTPAFWDIVGVNTATEDAELADVLEALENPDAVTSSSWSRRPKEPALHPASARIDSCGYVSVQNPKADDGYWRVDKRRQPIYAKASLSLEERLCAARRLLQTRGKRLTVEHAPINSRSDR